jgi:uncharacterized protein (TIGR00255 family)
MLVSMTGFGNATVEADGLTVTAEVKTLNSKFLDIFVRLPRGLNDREIDLKNLLTQQLERGKVELSVNLNRTVDLRPGLVINRPVVAAYVADLRDTAHALKLTVPDADLLRLALTQPNTYHAETADPAIDPARADDWQTVLSAVQTAVQRCRAFRQQEGAALDGKLREYIGAIAAGLEAVERQDALRIPAVRERMRAGVTEMLTADNFDPNRFEQELVYYIEKFDISEEKVRLKNHLDYFIEVLSTEEANGKKLNFISQELGREINTIGSKANDAAIQRIVVGMKDELEKIKEQTLNVV